MRLALFSGSLALNVASDPLWFSSTASALLSAVTALAAANEMLGGSSTSVTSTIKVMLSLVPWGSVAVNCTWSDGLVSWSRLASRVTWPPESVSVTEKRPVPLRE